MATYNIGDKVLGGWTIDRLIGEGSYGKVFEVSKSGYGVTTTSALKVITIPPSQQYVKNALSEGMDDRTVTTYFRGLVDQLMIEVATMAALKGHSGIVGYEDHEVFEHPDEVGWDILLRMEKLTCLTDIQRENPLPPEDVLDLGMELCRALDFCHSKGIIHRDIKPENIFIDDIGHYKLGDFGVARHLGQVNATMSKKGTEAYMAPELYAGKNYDTSVDTYALGLVLYRLLNGNRLPFYPLPPEPITPNARENALRRRVAGEKFPAPLDGRPQLNAVIERACAINPADRYSSAKEMMEALRRVDLNAAAEEPVHEEPLRDAGKTMGIWDWGRFEDNIKKQVAPVSSDTQEKHNSLPSGSYVPPATEKGRESSEVNFGSFRPEPSKPISAAAPSTTRFDTSRTTQRIEAHRGYGGRRNSILGVDLGSAYIKMAILDDSGEIAVLRPEGLTQVPAVLGFQNGRMVFGNAAITAKNFIYGLTSLLGKSYNEAREAISDIQPHYMLAPQGTSRFTIECSGFSLAPEEALAHILRYLRAHAEVILGESVTEAVISVPNSFGFNQRNAVEDACDLMGWTKVTIIGANDAAALCFGFHDERGLMTASPNPFKKRDEHKSRLGGLFGKKNKAASTEEEKNEKYIIVDLGDRFINMGLYEIGDGIEECCRLYGEMGAAADSWARKIALSTAQNLVPRIGMDLSQDVTAFNQLSALVQVAIEGLAENDTSSMPATPITMGEQTINLSFSITRDEFEAAIARYLSTTRKVVQDLYAGIFSPNEKFQGVIFTGGACRQPAIQNAILEVINTENFYCLDFSAGCAAGAAVHGSVLGGSVEGMALLSVLPQTLSIETAGGVCTPVIKKDETIPVVRSVEFSTSTDNQTTIDLHVLQGESPVAAECASLGMFRMSGIPPKRAGEPRVAISFDINASFRNLNVSAVEETSGVKQTVTMTNSILLTDNEKNALARKIAQS